MPTCTGLAQEITGPEEKWLTFSTGRHYFVQQALGLGFAMKPQPAPVVHTGKRIPVCGPLITSFPNAGFLLIIVH